MGEPAEVFDYDHYINAAYISDSKNLRIAFIQDKAHAFIYSKDIQIENLSKMFD